MMVLSTIYVIGGLPIDLMSCWAQAADRLEKTGIIQSRKHGMKIMNGSMTGQLFWSFRLTRRGLAQCEMLTCWEG